MSRGRYFIHNALTLGFMVAVLLLIQEFSHPLRRYGLSVGPEHFFGAVLIGYIHFVVSTARRLSDAGKSPALALIAIVPPAAPLLAFWAAQQPSRAAACAKDHSA